MSDTLVRGWCPGARRPMRSGDGLIVRLRITGGRLAPETARAIAGLAARHGNGELDLGRRGGLQIRGIRDDRLAGVETELADLGLLDADAGAEAVRNVVASPLSDFDDTAEGDAFALAHELEAALVADDFLRALPGKFGFSIDDGGRFGLADVPADVRLRLANGDVAISLDGDIRVVELPPEAAVAATLRLAHAFLDLAPDIDPPPRRMAALVAHVGAEAVFAAAGLAVPGVAPSRPPGTAPLIGALPTHIGAGLPFGRLTAGQLCLLADLAVSDIRLTPFRAVLLPGATADILPRLADAGFVTRPDDPILAVAACPGAPACGSASIETRGLARRLAALKPEGHGVWLHVSGCEKGCASSAAHAVTLVGRDGGLDLVLDGRPTDPPRHTGLSPEAVEALFRSGTIDR
ncbi:precorrin-3B synthase [Pleomorphomonas carboxyditropha]|uniref:Precorrin-3B synthase n=1 Tax=Pleomorphomonas carboxyditropha TaxID=2023338 RepID=A0A2G9WW73_9HYPH|nr:precorrin-3B synthase [Pleomorphomonas carboxyditropha]PIO98966.1 precorrin-3B synthase [Pleomorphomonas carboxyditropha]